VDYVTRTEAVSVPTYCIGGYGELELARNSLALLSHAACITRHQIYCGYRYRYHTMHLQLDT
jgi:hypothetical protein